MNPFAKWKKLHDAGNLDAFNGNSEGVLWLKLKSVIRKDLVATLQDTLPYKIVATKLPLVFEELFAYLLTSPQESHELLDGFIREENEKTLPNVKHLEKELYKVKTFAWGGDYRNSLDKYLISQYVKRISHYDTVMRKLDTEIPEAVRGYLINSWYNHWTSILIENIFRSHKAVIPGLGKIKNVDFFIHNIPFDLKVTYFPAEFLKQQLREAGLTADIPFLKKQARQLGLSFSKTPDPTYEILEKIEALSTPDAKTALKEFHARHSHVIDSVLDNPRTLIQWLYENQGEMRFSSENRLFLVLIDKKDFASAWKLKRNLDLLSPKIKSYLDNFHKKDINALKMTFKYPSKPGTFTAISDIIFVIKE